ncbi:hypothetical protein LEP1GSC165_3970 [Leptospira santarosai str. CBC523]|nr:hypothetical protein LEP1GSC040_2604 [Leptospira santarosai str. 2000030832]EMO12311.1 hypothetical protein LEP1GSC165_3970 [Leptospira santarosai str. CBC523]
MDKYFSGLVPGPYKNQFVKEEKKRPKFKNSLRLLSIWK